MKVRRQKHLKLHAKLIMIDRQMALIGSMNIDRSAFDLRRELGIETDAPEVVARCVELFNAIETQGPTWLDPLDPDVHEEGSCLLIPTIHD